MYESYRPKTLENTKEYINFVLRERSILPNILEEVSLDPELETLEQPKKPDLDFASHQKFSAKYSTVLASYLHSENEKQKEAKIRGYLCFDSFFECGNLNRVVMISQNEFDLYLNGDTNSSNKVQWFYFAVTNTKANLTVKFNIMNQTKFPYFYKEGMSPLAFSEKDNANMYTAWTYKVENVSVNRSSNPTSKQHELYKIILSENDTCDAAAGGPRPFYYVTSFSYTFKHDDDKVYFSYNKPYSYSKLNNLLIKYEKNLIKDGTNAKTTISQDENNDTPWILQPKTIETYNGIYYKREILCYSMGGIPIYMLTISGNSTPGIINSKRKYVVITARIHSSETPGSYKIQGIIKFLLSKDPIAESLRSEFIFLIVPMLNPDGVVLGNNRCSLGGYDLNRCWGHPLPNKQPTIFAIKQKLQEIVNKGKQIYVYCDLHGHSKLLNSFIYACHKVSCGSFCSWTKVRLLPRILAKKCHLVDYHKCSFKVEPEKVNTARVIVWKEFKVTNSFTMESSIYGYSLGDEVVWFSEREYIRIGEALMNALHDYVVLIGQMQTEMSETKDWLKPGRLIELTGMPAADVLKNKIQSSKEEERKRERREKLKIKVQMTKIPSFQKVVENKISISLPKVCNAPHKSRAASCVTNQLATKTENIQRQPNTATAKQHKIKKENHNSSLLMANLTDSQKSSWKDYFSVDELEELATGTPNSNEIPPSSPGKQGNNNDISNLDVDIPKKIDDLNINKKKISLSNCSEISQNEPKPEVNSEPIQNFHRPDRKNRGSYTEKKSMIVPQILVDNPKSAHGNIRGKIHNSKKLNYSAISANHRPLTSPQRAPKCDPRKILQFAMVANDPNIINIKQNSSPYKNNDSTNISKDLIKRKRSIFLIFTMKR